MALTVEDEARDSCYRRIFVGVGLGELGERRTTKKPRLNSWEIWRRSGRQGHPGVAHRKRQPVCAHSAPSHRR